MPADLVHPEETYGEADWGRYEAECVRYDREGDRFAREDYLEWKVSQPFPELRPYADNGEVAAWRLELLLNEVGRAFLLVDRFASSGARQITP